MISRREMSSLSRLRQSFRLSMRPHPGSPRRKPRRAFSMVHRKSSISILDGKENTSRANTSGSSLTSSDSSGQTSPEHNMSAGTEETGASASADEIGTATDKPKVKTARSKSLTKGMLKLFKPGKSSDKNAAQTMPAQQKQQPAVETGGWRAGDSNLSNEDLLKILQEFKESGESQDDLFKKVQMKEAQVSAARKEQEARLLSPHTTTNDEAPQGRECRPGPSTHHEYDEPPENYATSIEEVQNGKPLQSDVATPSSPPDLVRAQSEEGTSLTPSLSASLSDDRSDLGSGPSSSPLGRMQKLGQSIRTKMNPLHLKSPHHKRKTYKVSRSHSSPVQPLPEIDSGTPSSPDSAPTSRLASPEHSLVSIHEEPRYGNTGFMLWGYGSYMGSKPSSDGKSTISSTNSDFSTTISTPSESCEPVCDAVRPVPPDMFNEYGEYTGHYCNVGIAIRDQMSLYNKEELQLKKGDVVYITSRSSEDGRWEGVCNGFKGKVKFVYLDVLNKADIARLQKKMRPGSLTIEGVEALLKLSSLKELLQRIGCEQYWSLLQLHQITTLDDFKHLEKKQLDDLDIKDDTHRIELLTAAKVLRDPKSDEATASRLSQASRCSTTSTSTVVADNPLLSRFSSSIEQRDSGFYAEGNGAHRKPSESEEAVASSRTSQDVISEEQEQNNENYNNSNGLLRNGHYNPAISGNPVPLDQGRRASPVLDQTARRGSPCPGQQGMLGSSVPDLPQDRHGSPVPPDQRLQHQITYQPVYHRHERRDVVQALNWTSYPSCPFPHIRDLGAVDMLSAHGGTVNGVFRAPPTRRNYSFDETESGVHSDPGIEVVSPLPSHRPPLPQRRWYTHDVMVSQQRRPSEPVQPVGIVDDIDYWRRSSLTDVYGGRSCDLPANPLAGPQKGLCPTHARGAAQRRHRKSRSVSPHKRHHHHHHREVATVMPNVHCMPTLPLRGSQRERAQSPSLDIMIEKKLDQEGIDLTGVPYSDKMGFCGIPPALVQRYAEEIEAQVSEVAQCLEAIRVKQLVEACRCWFRSDTLAQQSQKLVYAGSGQTVPDWLLSLGLPMYINVFITQGWDALEIVIAMEEDDLRKCGICNPKHLRRLMTAVEHLKMTWRT